MPGKTHAAPRHRKSGVITLCVIVILAALLAVLGVNYILSQKEHQRLSKAQEQQITELKQQLSEKESQLSDSSAKQKEQEQQIEKQGKQIKKQGKQIKKRDKQIKEQKNKLDQQQSTIDDLKKQLVIKKGSTTTTTHAVSRTTATSSSFVPSGKKMLALTFDDGPGPYTGQLLDALKQRGIHATFFVVGSRVDSYASLIKRMEAEGHVVGNHSFSHRNLKRMTASQIKQDMDASGAKINRLLGHWPVVMRCPGGNYNDTVKDYAKNAGIPMIQWSVDTRDWESRNVDKILREAFQEGRYGIRDGAIVLMHDIYSTSLEAAIKMMDKLQQQGYTMVTVPELLKAKKGGITPGTVYWGGF